MKRKGKRTIGGIKIVVYISSARSDHINESGSNSVPRQNSFEILQLFSDSLLKTLYGQVMDLAKKTTINAYIVCKADRNNALTDETLRTSFQFFLLLVLKEEFGSQKNFDPAMVLVRTYVKAMLQNADYLVINRLVLTLITKCAVEAVKLGGAMSVKRSIIIILLFPAPSKSNLLKNEEKKRRTKKGCEDWSHRGVVSLVSLSREI